MIQQDAVIYPPRRRLAFAMAASIAARRNSAFGTTPRAASIRSLVPLFTRKASCSSYSLGRVTRRWIAFELPLVESIVFH